MHAIGFTVALDSMYGLYGISSPGRRRQRFAVRQHSITSNAVFLPGHLHLQQTLALCMALLDHTAAMVIMLGVQGPESRVVAMRGSGAAVERTGPEKITSVTRQHTSTTQSACSDQSDSISGLAGDRRCKLTRFVRLDIDFFGWTPSAYRSHTQPRHQFQPRDTYTVSERPDSRRRVQTAARHCTASGPATCCRSPA
jgi:hypothetical protein